LPPISRPEAIAQRTLAFRRMPLLVGRVIATDRRALEASQPELAGRPLPADMLTTSASGLDPDISPADAAMQVVRVARARGIPIAEINQLLQHHITGRSLGIFGEPRVNVLALNLALDEKYSSSSARLRLQDQAP
jgi:potassium-transporting ATPase KdpC subunit